MEEICCGMCSGSPAAPHHHRTDTHKCHSRLETAKSEQILFYPTPTRINLHNMRTQPKVILPPCSQLKLAQSSISVLFAPLPNPLGWDSLFSLLVPPSVHHDI